MAGRKLLSSDYVPPSVFTPFLRRFTDERAHELSETIALYDEVRTMHFASAWAHEQGVVLVSNIIAERVIEAVELPISPAS